MKKYSIFLLIVTVGWQACRQINVVNKDTSNTKRQFIEVVLPSKEDTLKIDITSSLNRENSLAFDLKKRIIRPLRDNSSPYDYLDTIALYLNDDTIPEHLIAKPFSNWCGTQRNCFWEVLNSDGYSMGMLHGSIFEVDTTKMENSYYNINAIVGYNDQSYIKGSYHVDENLYYSLISDRSYALNDSIIAYIFQSDTLYNCLKNY